MGNDGDDACALGNHVDHLLEHLWFTTPVGLPDRTIPPDASVVDVVRLFQLLKLVNIDSDCPRAKDRVPCGVPRGEGGSQRTWGVPRGLAAWCTPTIISHRHLISIENPLVDGCKVKRRGHG